MIRYISRPVKIRQNVQPYYEEEFLHVPDVRVFEDDDPQETGLLDARGNTIYRVKERGKLGF